MVEVHILKLLAIFFVIVVVLTAKRPMHQAILSGIFATALLYQINPLESIKLIAVVLQDWNAMSIVLVLYLITLLQRMLEKRSQIKLAQKDLDNIFHNRRVNASLAPMFIGLLPSAAAMILCSEIVKTATQGHLNKKEQAFVSSWFRHIPESTLPTYSGVLLMSNLSGVSLPDFILCMIVPVIFLVLLGYYPYIHKLPKETGSVYYEQSKTKNFIGLIKHLWTLLGILALILACGLRVEVSILLIILIAVFVYAFSWSEIKPMFVSAIEKRMLLSTFFILVFKEFVAFSGAINALPEFFSNLPIPSYLVFALLFFVGGVISGSNGIIALGTTMAFAVVPNAGVPLMMLLMCMCHAASLVSPTHVCIAVTTEYFGISFGELVQKTLPASLLFCILMVVYYNLLLLFML